VHHLEGWALEASLGRNLLPGGQRFLVVLGEPGSGEPPDHVVTDWTRLLDR
jgi:hypothetical protein